MRKLYALPVMLVLAGSLIFPTNVSAKQNHFFDRLIGSWKGKGFLTTSVGAKEEAIRCRLRNRKDKEKPKLVLTGNCGIGGILIPITGWIQQSGKSKKKFTASLFKNLAFLRIDSFTGRLRGSRLKLNFKGRDKVSKEFITASITIYGKSKDRFDILLSSTDPKSNKPFKVGTIIFSRR